MAPVAHSLPLLLLLAASHSTVAGQAPPAPADSAATAQAMDSARAVEIFDAAWSRIGQSYYDSTFGGRSWDAVGDTFRARAAEAGTEPRLRAVLQEMLDGIGDSHFALIPREAADALDPDELAGDPAAPDTPGDLGMDVRVVEGAVTVVRVEDAGPAHRGGIRPGWIVEAVDERTFDEALAALEDLDGEVERTAGATRLAGGAAAALRGNAGSRVQLTLQPGSGPTQVLTLVRRRAPGELIQMGNLPAMMARLEGERLDEPGGCVGIIRMSIWLAPLAPAFDRAVDTFRGCQGIVVDLRGNLGGVGGMVMGAAGHFLDTVVPLGTMRSRTAEMRFVSNPRRVNPEGEPVEVFSGPLAILVDDLSVSTSEIFAAGMQAAGRARVFGSRTPGQALPSALIRLPNGDVLQHAIADFTSPDGTRIEGRGVIPDVETPLSRELLLDGRDPAREAAVAWILASGGGGG